MKANNKQQQQQQVPSVKVGIPVSLMPTPLQTSSPSVASSRTIPAGSAPSSYAPSMTLSTTENPSSLSLANSLHPNNDEYASAPPLSPGTEGISNYHFQNNENLYHHGYSPSNPIQQQQQQQQFYPPQQQQQQQQQFYPSQQLQQQLYPPNQMHQYDQQQQYLSHQISFQLPSQQNSHVSPYIPSSFNHTSQNIRSTPMQSPPKSQKVKKYRDELKNIRKEYEEREIAKFNQQSSSQQNHLTSKNIQSVNLNNPLLKKYAQQEQEQQNISQFQSFPNPIYPTLPEYPDHSMNNMQYLQEQNYHQQLNQYPTNHMNSYQNKKGPPRMTFSYQYAFPGGTTAPHPLIPEKKKK